MMIDLLKQTLDRNSLIIILAAIILSIGGLYKLSEKHDDEMKASLAGQSEALHALDKRVTVTETLLRVKDGN